MAVQNYTLGRGKVFFSRFKPGTQVPEGFRYIGNTPEFNMTIESENLDHFSSDEGIREKDDSVPLQVTRSGSLTTDNVDPQNVALFFFGTASVLHTAAAPGLNEEFLDTIKGYSYKLGQSPTNPSGYRGIDPTDFNISLKDVALTAASKALTVASVGTAGDTVTIGGVVYTLRAVPALPYEVDIGVDADTTAANIAAAINAGAGAGTAYGTDTVKNPYVSAAAVAAVVTVTARRGGTSGNSIAIAENGSGLSWAAAAVLLSGGVGATFTPDVDYKLFADTGRFEILDTGSIANLADLDVYYSVLQSNRSVVISGSTPVEGAIMFEAYNPKGLQSDYYMAWAKITPNGDYALKGDEWQTIPYNIEILKPTVGDQAAILMDGRPAYV